jgi:hypothetical protein
LQRIRWILNLPSVERAALTRAVWLIASVRLGLLLLPFGRVSAWTARPATVLPFLTQLPASRLVWAVRAVARRIPGATCLTQALALQMLMASAGRAAEIRIGVARSPAFTAHAWVEHEGVVLLGDDGELDRYATILALAGPPLVQAFRAT